jgi:hypothetical protein
MFKILANDMKNNEGEEDLTVVNASDLMKTIMDDITLCSIVQEAQIYNEEELVIDFCYQINQSPIKDQLDEEIFNLVQNQIKMIFQSDTDQGLRNSLLENINSFMDVNGMIPLTEEEFANAQVDENSFEVNDQEFCFSIKVIVEEEQE